jgi:CubicO group peptidase (beta-lactamase class C family)
VSGRDAFERRALERVRQLAGPNAGMQVSVSTRSGVLADFALGMATRTERMRGDTVNRVYCAGKPVVVLGTLKACETRRLALETPIGDVVEGMPAGTRATVRDLLTYTAGYHLFDPPIPVPGDRDRVFAYMRDLRVPGSFAVGRVGHYDGYISMTLLGFVLQAAVDEPLEEYLAREVLAPLGLRRTFFRPSAQQCTLPRADVFASGSGSATRRVDALSKVTWDDFYDPSGGWYSTAAELRRVYECFMPAPGVAGRVVHDEWIELACANQREGVFDDKYRSYALPFGLGVMIDLTTECRRIGRAAGSVSGLGSGIGFADREQGVVMTVVTNQVNSDVVRKVTDALYDELELADLLDRRMPERFSLWERLAGVARVEVVDAGTGAT